MNSDDGSSVLAGNPPSDPGVAAADHAVPHADDPYAPAGAATVGTPATAAGPGGPDRLAALRDRMATYESGRRSAVIAGVVLALLVFAVVDAVAIGLTAGPGRAGRTSRAGATADLVAAVTAGPNAPLAVVETTGPGSARSASGAGPTARPAAHPAARRTAAARPAAAHRPVPAAGAGRRAPAPAAAAPPPTPHLVAAMTSSPTSTRYSFTVRNTGSAALRITAITLTRGRDVPSVNVLSDGAGSCRGATLAPGAACGWSSIILPPVVNPFRTKADLLSGAWCYETIRSNAPGTAAELGFDVGLF